MKYIYQIENQVNGKKYVGQTQQKYPSIRWCSHKTQLRNNTHGNTHLQRAYNKYGEDNFIFSLIEVVSGNKDITEREQYWIDFFKDTYNKRPAAGSNLGLSLTEEHKKKLAMSISITYQNKRKLEKPFNDQLKSIKNLKRLRMNFEDFLKLYEKDISKISSCICFGMKDHKVEVDDLKQEANIKLWDLFQKKIHLEKERNYIVYAIKNHLISYIKHEKLNPLSNAISLNALTE